MSRDDRKQVLFQILISQLLQDVFTCGAGRNGVGAGRNPCETVDQKRRMQPQKTCWGETNYVLTPPYAISTEITSNRAIGIDLVIHFNQINKPRRYRIHIASGTVPKTSSKLLYN